MRSQTGNHSCLVPPPDCPEVRWLQESWLSRTTTRGGGDRTPNRPDGAGELRLGLQPYLGCPCQPWSQGLRSDSRQYFEESRDPSNAKAQPKDHLEVVHFGPHVSLGRNGLLHRRGLNMAWPRHVLRAVLHPTGNP